MTKSRTYLEGKEIIDNSIPISSASLTVGDIRCVSCKARCEFAPTNMCPICSGELREMFKGYK